LLRPARDGPEAKLDIPGISLEARCLFKIVHLILALLASNSLKDLGIIRAFLAVRCAREYKSQVRRLLGLAFSAPAMGKI
jgi:hypothetical protein